MSLKLYMEQDGEGCDYTIGCGERLVDLKETDLYLAHDEAIEIIKEYTNSETTIGRAYIVEIREDLSKHASVDIPKQKADEKALQEREEKMRQLEKLKKELGVK